MASSLAALRAAAPYYGFAAAPVVAVAASASYLLYDVDLPTFPPPAAGPPATATAPQRPTATAAPPPPADAAAPGVDPQTQRQLQCQPEEPPFWHIFKVFAPWNILNVIARNVALSYVVVINTYMQNMLNHESLAIQCEEEDRDPPPPPAFPAWQPPLYAGLFYSAREIFVQAIRRVFEWRVVIAVGYERARPLMRDHRKYIREMLALQLRGKPPLTRLFHFFTATLHSQLLFYSADCVVMVAIKAFNTFTSAETRHWSLRKRLAQIGKGAVLHLARCFVTWLAVGVGASLCALIHPGYGPAVGTLVTDYGVTLWCYGLLHAAMLTS